MEALKKSKTSFVPDWTNCWLADELREELAKERGQLEVGADVRRECDTIVHREFGHTKRLSEQEKKQLSSILRERSQLTKNIWQARLTETNCDKIKEEELLTSKQEVAAHLRDDIWQFVEDNAKRVTEGHSGVSRQTSRGLLMGGVGMEGEERQPLESVKSAVVQLKKMVNGSLLAAEWLDHERTRVLRWEDRNIIFSSCDVTIKLKINGMYYASF